MSDILQQLEISNPVQRYLSTGRKMLIGGKWVNAVSEKCIDTVDPATGKVLTTVPQGDAADVDLAVMAARKAFESGPWPDMTPSQRSHLIWKIGDLILEHRDELAELESLDNGKQFKIAQFGDVPMSAEIFHYMSGWATKHHGMTIPISIPGQVFHAYTLNEPVGVCGQIIPWNFPLLMAAFKLAPMLATGCTTVLKPAEQTSLSALRLGEIIQEAGIPDGVVNIVTGYGETAGAAIAEHPGVDKIAFTGSSRVGKSIVRAAAGNLKRVSLELGGKSPNIILKDADLDIAIEGAAHAIFDNHGQACVAGSRLFIHESIFDKVVEGVSDYAKSIKIGAGLNPGSEMGPLISSIQLDRVMNYIDAGTIDRARIVTGGKRINSDGYYIEPTVFVDTDDEMKIVKEEIFGPVVAAMPFSEVSEDLVRRANDTSFGLAGGIWTQDISKAHRLAAKLKAGIVWINTYAIFDAALPFGGYKESGWGRELGAAVLEHYTEMKAVACRL